MVTLEQISMIQRMVGSIKEDVEAGNTYKVLGKLEIIDGELSIVRTYAESPVKEELAETIENPNTVEEIVDNAEIID